MEDFRKSQKYRSIKFILPKFGSSFKRNLKLLELYLKSCATIIFSEAGNPSESEDYFFITLSQNGENTGSV